MQESSWQPAATVGMPEIRIEDADPRREVEQVVVVVEEVVEEVKMVEGQEEEEEARQGDAACPESPRCQLLL